MASTYCSTFVCSLWLGPGKFELYPIYLTLFISFAIYLPLLISISLFPYLSIFISAFNRRIGIWINLIKKPFFINISLLILTGCLFYSCLHFKTGSVWMTWDWLHKLTHTYIYIYIYTPPVCYSIYKELVSHKFSHTYIHMSPVCNSVYKV